MRTVQDAARSVKRYVALALGSEWEVRFWSDRGEFAYPFAKVSMVGSVLTAGPASFSEFTLPMAIQCYPEPAETADEAVVEASDVMTTLLQAFRVTGVDLGRPLRIPLYDYDGLALEEGSTSRSTPDYLRVLDFSPRLLPDPDDPRQVAVVSDLRVNWRVVGLDSGGFHPRGTHTVKSVEFEEDWS